MSCARPRCPQAQPHRSSSFHYLPRCRPPVSRDNTVSRETAGSSPTVPDSSLGMRFGNILDELRIALIDLDHYNEVLKSTRVSDEEREQAAEKRNNAFGKFRDFFKIFPVMVERYLRMDQKAWRLEWPRWLSK